MTAIYAIMIAYLCFISILILIIILLYKYRKKMQLRHTMLYIRVFIDPVPGVPLKIVMPPMPSMIRAAIIEYAQWYW